MRPGTEVGRAAFAVSVARVERPESRMSETLGREAEADLVAVPRTSSVLQVLAPHLASQFAHVFPFPHLKAFALPAARLHLLGLAFAGQRSEDVDINLVMQAKWSDAVKLLVDPGPVGLEGILSKATLPLWSAETYQKLWSMISCPTAYNVLLHCQQVTPTLIEVLVELSPALRHQAVVVHLHRPLEASVLRHAFSNERDAKTFVRSLKSVGGRYAFFGKAIAVATRLKKFAATPTIDYPSIKPISDAAMLRRTALRFRNCLRDFEARARRGEVAFYVYDGVEPAVIMVTPRVGGAFVVDRIRGLNNEDVSGVTATAIREAFKRIGIGDRADEHRRNAIDFCLTRLRLATVDAGEDIDGYCSEFLGQLQP